MKSVRHSLIGLALFTVVAIIAGMFIVNAIRQPLHEATQTYRVEFSDVTGLRPGNDVRMLGTRVGKVTGIDLQQSDGGEQTFATVTVDVVRSHPIPAAATLAVKYLNLAGTRYVSVAGGDGDAPAGSTIGLDHTVPSFDITQVFNGLGPVLSGMRPDDLNHLAASLLAVIQGDGTGLGTVISSLSTILDVVDKREDVVNRIVDNLSVLQRSLNGRAGRLGELIDYIDKLTLLMGRLEDNYRELSKSGLEVLAPVNDLMESVGLTRTTNPDGDYFTRLLLPYLSKAVDIISYVPALVTAIDGALNPPPATVDLRCTKGRAEIPKPIAMFLQGQRITLCKPS